MKYKRHITGNIYHTGVTTVMSSLLSDTTINEINRKAGMKNRWNWQTLDKMSELQSTEELTKQINSGSSAFNFKKTIGRKHRTGNFQ